MRTPVAGGDVTRIVVADDDRVTSHLLCAVLRKGGYEVDAAFDVPAVFDVARTGPIPAAMLLDMHMPGGDGMETVRRLRSDAVLAQVPLVIISGSDEESDHDALLALGCPLFLMKPLAPRVVLEAVATALGGKPAS